MIFLEMFQERGEGVISDPKNYAAGFCGDFDLDSATTTPSCGKKRKETRIYRNFILRCRQLNLVFAQHTNVAPIILINVH